MKEKKKSKKIVGIIWFIIALVFWLFEGLSDSDLDGDEFFGVLFGVAVMIAVIGLLVWIVRKRKTDSSDMRRDAHGHAETPTRHPDPRTKSFSTPDPYCVVCDQTGEDHFARDKAQRIAQLDDWLRNGLIGREEYKALKEKFEKS